MLPYLVLFLSIIITTFNRGFFNLPAIAILICLYIIIFYLLRTKVQFSPALLPYTFIIIYILFLFHASGIYQVNFLASVFLDLLPILFLPLVLTYAFKLHQVHDNSKIIRFWSLIVLALSLRILIILASPTPTIDVYTILKEAPNFLLQGKNPYQVEFSTVYPGVVSNYFSYFPVSFLVEIPFVLIFGDPRILLVTADIVSALFLYHLGKKTQTSQILSLVYLFRPNSIFMIEQSWLTPVLFLFLLMLMRILLKRKKDFDGSADISSGIFSGVLSSIQPHFLLVVLFFVRLSQNKIKFLLSFLTTLFITVIPFIIWDWRSFLGDTIINYMRTPAEMITVPVYRSLNLNTIFYIFTRSDLPRFVSVAVTLLILIWLSVYAAKKPFNIEKLALALVFFFLTFFLFLPFAFIDHFYFIGGLIILWITLIGRGFGKE